MRINMPHWMAQWVEEQDESPKSYINRLIENHKYLFPVINSFNKDEVYRSMSMKAYHKNFQLTHENDEIMRNLHTGSGDIYATNIRSLIAEDYYYDGFLEEQELISFKDFVDQLHKQKIDLKLINDNCDIEYEQARTMEEFTEMVLQLHPGDRYSSGIETFSTMKRPFSRYVAKPGLSKEIKEQLREFHISFQTFFNNLSNGDKKLAWANERVKVSYSDGWDKLHETAITTKVFPKEYLVASQPVSAYFSSSTDGEGVLLPFPNDIQLKQTTERFRSTRDFYVIHSNTQPAIRWKDETFYALEGIPVPEKFIETPQDITKQEFTKIDNAELRRNLTEHMGADKLAQLLDLTTVNKGKYGDLLRTKEEDSVTGTHLWFVKVVCPSTNRVYHIPVDRNGFREEDADAAIAWTFELSKYEYAPKVET
jgi:hypothetical protein